MARNDHASSGEKMSKLVANMPQSLSGSQFLLKFDNVNISDDLTLIFSNKEVVLTRGTGKNQTMNFLHAFEHNTSSNYREYLLDLEQVPAEVTQLDFMLRAFEGGYRSWVMEGQNGDFEAWQNEGIEFTAGSSCVVLELMRIGKSQGWRLVARNSFVGENNDGIEDDKLPETVRSLAAIAGAKNLAHSAEHVLLLIDTSESMRPYLSNFEAMEAVISAAQAATASATNRPLEISYNGVVGTNMTLTQNANEVHESSFRELREASGAVPFEAFLQQSVAGLKVKATVFSLSDAMPAVDPDSIVPLLEKTDSYLKIILLEKQLFSYSLGDSPRITSVVLTSVNKIDAKEVLAQLS